MVGRLLRCGVGVMWDVGCSDDVRYLNEPPSRTRVFQAASVASTNGGWYGRYEGFGSPLQVIPRHRLLRCPCPVVGEVADGSSGRGDRMKEGRDRRCEIEMFLKHGSHGSGVQEKR